MAQRLPYAGWNEGHGSVSSCSGQHSTVSITQKRNISTFWLRTSNPPVLNLLPLCSLEEFSPFQTFLGITSDVMSSSNFATMLFRLSTWSPLLFYLQLSETTLLPSTWVLIVSALVTGHPEWVVLGPQSCKGEMMPPFTNVKEHHTMEKQFENRPDYEDYS